MERIEWRTLESRESFECLYAKYANVLRQKAKSEIGNQTLFSYQNFKQTEDNLVFLKNLPLSWQRRILVQRHEDFAVNPLKVMSGLYDFAELPVLEHVKIWLKESTHPFKNERMC